MVVTGLKMVKHVGFNVYKFQMIWLKVQNVDKVKVYNNICLSISDNSKNLTLKSMV
jgi:hypothetical protein